MPRRGGCEGAGSDIVKGVDYIYSFTHTYKSSHYSFVRGVCCTRGLHELLLLLFLPESPVSAIINNNTCGRPFIHFITLQCA